ELRKRRPVRIALQTLSDLGILEDVDVVELGSDAAQRRDGLSRESTLRQIGRALQVQQHAVLCELLLDAFVDVHADIKPPIIGAARQGKRGTDFPKNHCTTRISPLFFSTPGAGATPGGVFEEPNKKRAR